MEKVPLAALEREWERGLASVALARRFEGWRAAQSPLRSFGTPAAVLRFLRASDDPVAKDRVLEAMLREAPADPLAARFVLHAILPGLKGRAGDCWSTREIEKSCGRR